MSMQPFAAPDLETLTGLLPAYDFERFIAQGGMGAVYKARQRSLDRDVAIKILPRELGEDPAFRESFITEARAMARLNHPNLVSVYDSGDIDGMLFIVMEYLDGQSLHELSHAKKLEPIEAAKIIRGVCEGLKSAHELKIIHRDIKPANIFMTSRGEPKIGDFGLARPSGRSAAPGLLMGTPGYAAPELIDHPATADHRSDIFAVGVMFYVLLTGDMPGPKPAPPSQVCGAPQVLSKICLQAIHPNPAFRFQSAAAMSDALGAYLENPDATFTRPPLAGGKRLTLGGEPHRALRTGPKKAIATAAAPAPLVKVAAAGPAVPTVIHAPAAAAAAAASPPKVRRKVAKESTTARNIAIVCLLLIVGGIFYLLQRNTTLKTAAAAAEDLSAMPVVAASEEPEPADAAEPPPPPAEMPLESLARRKSALAAGDRSEMPAGTLIRNGVPVFYVPEPMGWYQAAAFAADHGAHLACPQTEPDLLWFGDQAQAGNAGLAWLGIGRAGRGWSLANGEPWMLGSQPPGDGNHVAVTSLGLLRARPTGETLPFFIQWPEAGADPAGLGEMLARTRESLTTAAPGYPPGTFVFGRNHYLIVAGTIDRESAAALAARAGGHLAAPASRGEASGLAQQAQAFDAGTTFWLGGRRTGDDWEWSTGQVWGAAAWAAGEPAADHGGLALAAGEGWRAVDDAGTAGGFIIEWNPALAASPEN
jgi:tRNA A-37 threonylcarbamoyl transferase component Bud32